MSIRRPRSLLQSRSHAILLSDKSRCREIECREGMLVQVGHSERERERDGEGGRGAVSWTRR